MADLKQFPTAKKIRKPLQQRLFVLPSLITAVSIFCGYLAILESFRGNFFEAFAYIILSIVLDGLDGRVARRLNATSEFGREFDSMSDIISFGVAPAVLLYTWGLSKVADEFGLIVSFLFVASGAVRLARFNIDTTVRKYFVGLPIPAGAAAIASLVYFHPEPIDGWLYSYGLIAYVLMLAALMVSTVPFISVKYLKLTEGNILLKFFLLTSFVALTWYSSKIVLLVATFSYAISGPLIAGIRRLFPNRFPIFERLFMQEQIKE